MSSLICIFWCKIAPSCLHFIDCFDLTGWNLIIFKISSLLFSVYPIPPYRHCVVRLGSRTGPLSKRHNGQNGSVEIASRSSEPSDEAPAETALFVMYCNVGFTQCHLHHPQVIIFFGVGLKPSPNGSCFFEITALYGSLSLFQCCLAREPAIIPASSQLQPATI